MQGIVHRGLLLRVERAYRAHESFERITRNHFMTFVRQAERNASSISLGSLPGQIPTRLKRLNGLRCGAAGRRLKFRKRRRGPREGVGASKKAERHPLGGAEFALVAVGLHKPPHEQQEFRRFAR
jgi:hypothetical protein